MVVLASAENLVTLFIGLELLSIPLYALCATELRRGTSLESGLKYLIVGSLGSATLLYGLAMIYGATGATDFGAIADAIGENVGLDDPLLLIGIALAAAGLAFKASVAPFHQWSPDVYQGAPTPITAFMATATKVAAFAVILRLFDHALGDRADQLGPRPRRARDGHDRDRQRRRAVPALAQAAAGVVRRRAGRLPARRRRGRHAARDEGDLLLPRRLPRHERRRVRRRDRARARVGDRRRPEVVRGPRAGQPAARVADDDRDARPRRASRPRPGSSGSSI